MFLHMCFTKYTQKEAASTFQEICFHTVCKQCNYILLYKVQTQLLHNDHNCFCDICASGITFKLLKLTLLMTQASLK